MKLLLAVLVLAALILFIWIVTSKAGSRKRSAATLPEALGGATAEVAPRKGPPSSGAGDPLEMIRAALPSMSSEEIEHLLDMGATLKPGAEDLFRRELRRRLDDESEPGS